MFRLGLAKLTLWSGIQIAPNQEELYRIALLTFLDILQKRKRMKSN